MTASGEHLLGLDMGTGSTKGVLTDLEGRIVAQASRDHKMSLPRPGWAEMDGERDWWGDLVAVCRELVDASGETPIAALTVSGLGPCLLVCDADVQPLRPAILYGVDMRATAEIEALDARFGRDEILRRCGKHLSSQAVGPKLQWVRDHDPDVWARTTRWYSSHSFVVARLTGEYVLDHHTASQCDPLYDLAANEWNRAWAEEVAPGLELPRLAWSGEVVGEVTQAAAAVTGLAAGTPVTAGTVDAWAEGFSAGAREPGELMLMYGSTVFFVQGLAELAAHAGLWTTAGVQRDSYTLAAGMATSGSLTSWVRELTGDVPFETLVEEAGAVPPGSDGLLVLPYFAGERSPIFDPRARGVVAGLTLRHGRGHLFRAVYEGIGFGIRQILDTMADAAGAPSRILAVGGGTQGGLWTQIVSDITDRPQVVPTETIGASYGDALLAGVAVGLLSPETDWSTVAAEVTPDHRNRGLYDELYGTYCELYPATREQVHVLARIQERAGVDALPAA